MKGSVTVAIPVYNGERYLADALQSVVEQSERCAEEEYYSG
ncbi:MAG: glycosyltransferase [bacterium]